MVANWDLVFIVFFSASVLFSLLLKEEIVVTLLGTYVGMVVANQWGEGLYNLITQQAQSFQGGGSIEGTLSVFSVQIIAFAIIILVISFKGGILIHPESVGRGFLSYLTLLAYGFLTAALIASATLSYLPEGLRETITLSSVIADQIVSYSGWWVILPILLMFLVNIKGVEAD